MELGFVEEVEDPEELTSPYCASKVGGRPAWLDPLRIPSAESFRCKECRKPLIHLLQIQSSSLADEDGCHRTIFIFMCADSKCHSPGDSSTFIVLRCELGTNTGSIAKTRSCDQLDSNCEGADSQSNDCASAMETKGVVPPVAQEDVQKDVDGVRAPALCIVCGTPGPKQCGNCKMVHYCCREHQVHDWRAGHKQVCADLTDGKLSPKCLDYDPSVGVVLPELEIVTELEPSICKERSEEERMMAYHKFLEENGCSRAEVASVEDLEKATSASNKIDKQFRAFKKRISVEPTQVLRYQRNGEPLFVSGERIPKPSDIPSCQCGAKRTFELQVMPQLLYYLKLDQDSLSPRAGIDWGTLIVYTCSSPCCSLGSGCHQEFLWKQDIL